MTLKGGHRRKENLKKNEHVTKFLTFTELDAVDLGNKVNLLYCPPELP